MSSLLQAGLTDDPPPTPVVVMGEPFHWFVCGVITQSVVALGVGAQLTPPLDALSLGDAKKLSTAHIPVG